MASLSLREAAEQTGVSKSTIFRAIKAGRMSSPRDADGNFAIDPAELFRVYPPKTEKPDPGPVARDVSVAPETRPADRYASDFETVELRVRNAALEAEIKGLRAMADELRQARDKWESQAERLTLALAAPKPEPVIPMPAPASVPPETAETPVARRGWWSFRKAG
jgi:excisionase family DNA binding protein